MHISNIQIENFRCFGAGDQRFELTLGPALTALVGENDCGKTAIIDAFRIVLGTSDQEWYRLEDTDFHNCETSKEIRIALRFIDLAPSDLRAFVEYLTYGDSVSSGPVLYLNWTAKDTGDLYRGRPYRRIELRSGKNGSGPSLAQGARELLRTTYLRPLRDAEQALSAGRGSRLSHVLQHSPEVLKTGNPFDPGAVADPKTLNVLGIADFTNALLREQKGVADARRKIDSNLRSLALEGSPMTSRIEVSGANAPEEARLRQLLEKLDLFLDGDGRLGLGSNNLLFMACELLLLSEEEGYRLLLIEEPEAHLHAQRQLRVMQLLQEDAQKRGIQVLITTHSPNLASAINLSSLAIIQGRHAFPLSEDRTTLSSSDYRFLRRFLDATKANLFFSRGVLIVEGDAENILLPTLARALGRGLTEHGVSVVNVGGVGLRRYARIFIRKDLAADGPIATPVACLGDMDIRPNCAATILKGGRSGSKQPDIKPRRWRMRSDFDENGLADYEAKREQEAQGQNVRSFISDHWTFEYDLALGRKRLDGTYSLTLAPLMHQAIALAKKDDKLQSGEAKREAILKAARKQYSILESEAQPSGGSTKEEVLATHVYRPLARKNVSKPITAQYLAELIEDALAAKTLTAEQLRSTLPLYLVSAIDYVAAGSQMGSGHDR